MNKYRCLVPMIIMAIFTLSGCGSSTSNKENIDTRVFGIFKVLENNTVVEMQGTINTPSLSNFNVLINAFPSVSTIHIVECDGSEDDEINLLLSEKVYEKNMHIHLLDNGTIASGGVDFFLAGTKRTKGIHTKIGVHSWATDDSEATDFDDDAKEHDPYIDYFISVGMTEQEAEDFYFFTIYAAPADEIHWMTDSEIVKYKILKP